MDGYLVLVKYILGLKYVGKFRIFEFENPQKIQAKILVKSNKSKKKICEIAFLAVLNFFPVEKMIFGHF